LLRAISNSGLGATPLELNVVNRASVAESVAQVSRNPAEIAAVLGRFDAMIGKVIKNESLENDATPTLLTAWLINTIQEARGKIERAAVESLAQ
jgi:hypothetical protein